MVLQQLDLFASQLQFHADKNMRRMRSFQGGLISISIIILAIIYFSYLVSLYANNLIDPKFKMQVVISEEKIEVQLDNEFFGFNYFIDTNQPLSGLEKEKNLNYLQFYPVLGITSKEGESFKIPLDAFECSSQKLNGFYCIDFSKAEEYKLVINDKQNYNSELYIVGYKCVDKDFFKETVPSNCANEEEIDEIMNGMNGHFLIKAKVSQFNTTSEQMDVKYKKFDFNFQGGQQLYSKIKSMKQISQVKKGPFIQSTNSYTSVIDYRKEDRTFDLKTVREKSGFYAFSQITISLDEQIQYIEIQYATFLEILSIFNSTLAVLMGLGLVGKYFSKKLLLNQFQLTLLREFYCQSYKNLFKLSIINQLKSNQKIKKAVIDSKVEITNKDITINNKNKENNKFFKNKEITDKNRSNKIIDKKINMLQQQLETKKLKQQKKEKVKSDNITYQTAIQSLNNDNLDFNKDSSNDISLQDYSTIKQNNIQQLQTSSIQLEKINYLNQKKTVDLVNSIKNPNQQYQLQNIGIQSNQKLLSQTPQQTNSPSLSQTMQNENPMMLSQKQSLLISKQLYLNKEANIDDNFIEMMQQFDQVKEQENQTNEFQEEINQKQNQVLNKLNLSNAAKLLNSKEYEQQITNLLKFSKQIQFKLIHHILSNILKLVLGNNIYNMINQTFMIHKLIILTYNNKLFLNYRLNKSYSEIQNKQFKNIKQSIMEQTDNCLNIFHLYKELLFLKKAVMVLLSDDQFATINIIGCNFKEDIDTDSENNNHMNNLLSISRSKDLLIENQEKFFERIQNTSKISQIDKRIISSLID